MNIEEFYAVDPRRRSSGESDYGVWWTERNTRWPRYRVSYIQATGEVYAVALDAKMSKVEVLARVAPDSIKPGDVYTRTLNSILNGWAEECGLPDSLAWIRRRLQPYDDNGLECDCEADDAAVFEA